MNGFQVFGRHNVLVVYIQFHIRFLVAHRIRAAAYLHTGTPIGRVIHFVQRQIALTGDCHAQGTVTEHFNTNLFARRATYILFYDMTIDLRHLLQIQFAGKHYHIGKLGIESQSLYIGYIQLGRKMYLLPDPAGITHHRHIGSDHSRNTGFFRRVNDSAQADRFR